MFARELFCGIETVRLSGGDIPVAGITSDSRRVEPGWMFVCHRGSLRDGHDYIDEALERGAVFCVLQWNGGGPPPEEVGLPESVGVAFCRDTRRTEALLWNRWYGDPAGGMKKIAVTGSNGKTSTVFILREILRSAGQSVGILTTVRAMADQTVLDMGNNGGASIADVPGAMTTPDPEYFYGALAEMKKRGVETVIYEASSQAILLRKTSAIVPDIAIFTNLTEEHLDVHGDMDTYLSVKAELFRGVPLGIINADDPYAERLPGMIPEAKFIRCSAIPERLSETDTTALRFRNLGSRGIEYVYFSELAVFRIATPLVCRHSVYNTMLAARCALALGVDPLTVKETLAAYCGVEGRMYRVDVGTEPPVQVFIDYAHTPAALASVLRSLWEIRREGQRIISVFGCGGDRDRGKRGKMGEISRKYADLTVLTSDNPRTEDPTAILSDIVSGMGRDGGDYAVIPDRSDAIRYAVESADWGDIILLAGKGHEKYEIDSSGKRPFDEEQIIREAIETVFGV